MGLFENLGRKVGELSHQAKEASKDQAEFQCADCETLIYSARETCPECGSERVVSRNDDDGADADRTDDHDGQADS